MHALRSLVLVSAMVMPGASEAFAQQPELSGGTRVRLVSAALPPDHQFARIVSADDDSVVFRSDVYPVTRSLARNQIDRIEVSRGIHRQTSRGALLGLAIGGISGIVLGAATYTPCEGFICFGPSNRSDAAALAGAALGLLGGVTGALIGAAHPREEWTPLTVKPTSARTASGERTFGIQVSRTF